MKTIPVTKPFLPPREEFDKYLDGIWDRNWLTNNGPLVHELESSLKEYLKIRHLLYLGNGTVAIQIAIKALKLSGEIITTPFSYVATTSSIVWENCNPIFVDIDPNSFNINPSLIENAITSKTTAILATHCFGNPCEIEQIEQIANKYGLKVIYDAAHCFGTSYCGKSVFEYGDISTTSFHATKLFHTIEGGAVFTNDDLLVKKMIHLRNFGHDGPDKFYGIGINGKNSEFHAAMGLVNLRFIGNLIEVRKNQSLLYDSLLKGLPLEKQRITENTDYNFSYYPVVFESEKQLLRVKRKLEEKNIFPRRYFYPSLNQLDYTGGFSMKVSESISSRIICLPLYHELGIHQQELVASIIRKECS